MAYTELFPKPLKLEHKYQIENDKIVETKDVVVHRFKLGDVEDPDIYAAGPLMDWQNSESGQWVMENAVGDPVWQRQIDYNTWGYSFVVIAKLKDADITYFNLKWGVK